MSDIGTRSINFTIKVTLLNRHRAWNKFWSRTDRGAVEVGIFQDYFSANKSVRIIGDCGRGDPHVIVLNHLCMQTIKVANMQTAKQ